MGILYYGDSGTPVEIDDRALAHLKIAITTKLRRNESFLLSWRHGVGQPRGRSSLWLHPAIPLRFAFEEVEAGALDREWIEDLMRGANSGGGIMLDLEHVGSRAAPTGPTPVEAA